MQIDLIDIGTNKIKIIKLIRTYTGMSLKKAKDIADSVPSSFIASVPDEKMYEIESKFSEAGAIIVIKSGIGNPKPAEMKNPVAKVLFSNKTENKTSESLNSAKEVKEYLERRQNRPAAIRVAVIAVIALTAGFTFLYSQGGYFHWWYKFIIGAVFGYAIRKAGKGVNPNFGMIALFSSIICVFTAKFSYYFIYAFKSGDFAYLGYAVSPYIPGLLTTLAAGILAFQLAFTRINEKNKQRFSSEVREIKGASEIIRERKEQMYDRFSETSKTKSKNKKIIKKESTGKERKKKKEKRRKNRRDNVIPGEDKQGRY